MRNKTRIYCTPFFWVVKGMEIWDVQNDLYISSKIISQIQSNYLRKKVAELSPKNFLNVILSEPLIIKFRENFEGDLKILIAKTSFSEKKCQISVCEKHLLLSLLCRHCTCSFEVSLSYWSHCLAELLSKWNC